MADDGCRVDRGAAVTRSLLGYGVLAGVVYVGVGLGQVLVRDGFDPTHHDLSLLAAGPWGWIQIANLVVSGLMVVAAAVGMRRAFRADPAGPGAVAGPILVAGYGLGLVVAGVFVADPMTGYPPGTPEGPPATVSASGIGHLVGGGVGFLCLVAATLVLARRFAARGSRGWAVGSVATGVVFLAGFLGVASGSAAPAAVLGLTVGVLAGWVWLAAVSVHLYRGVTVLVPVTTASGAA